MPWKKIGKIAITIATGATFGSGKAVEVIDKVGVDDWASAIAALLTALAGIAALFSESPKEK